MHFDFHTDLRSRPTRTPQPHSRPQSAYNHEILVESFSKGPDRISIDYPIITVCRALMQTSHLPRTLRLSLSSEEYGHRDVDSLYWYCEDGWGPGSPSLVGLTLTLKNLPF